MAGLQTTFTKLNIPNYNLAIAYDIGCVGNMADFINTYGIHTLHGRSIPVAQGIKLANPKLTVCVVGGDGGIYGEGLNHLVSAVRSDSPIKVIVSNNFLYSLTTGQTSPTTPKGSKTKSTPLGNQSEPINAVNLIKAINPKVFVKSIDGRNPIVLNQAILEALQTPGFALLDIQTDCIAFGKQLKS
jgi:2-oxoglutarate ferredoxin oxidoreductase subunit beta